MDNNDFLKIKELKEYLERLLDKINQSSNKIESDRDKQENLIANIQPFVNPQEFREYLKPKINRKINFKYYVESKDKIDEKFRNRKLLHFDSKFFTVQYQKGGRVSKYRIDRVVDYK